MSTEKVVCPLCRRDAESGMAKSAGTPRTGVKAFLCATCGSFRLRSNAEEALDRLDDEILKALSQEAKRRSDAGDELEITPEFLAEFQEQHRGRRR